MRQVQKGSADVSVDVYIIDSTDGTPETGVVYNTTGIDLEYRRQGNFAVNITEADLATPDLEDVHLDGGFLTIGHGLYRLDVPDAAFATGVSTVSIQGTVTGMIVLPQTIQLVDFDPEDGVRLGLTALPNAAADAAGGVPISYAGGLDLDAKLAATNEVTAARMAALTDWINGGRLDLILDAINVIATDWTNGGRLDLIIDAINVIAMDWTNAGRLDLLLDAIPTTAMRGTDSALTDKAGFSLSTAGILAIHHQAVTAIVTAGSIGKLLVDEITSARMAVLTDWINGGRLDLLLDAIPTTAMRGTDSAALASEVTGARMATLTDWIDGGRLDAILDSVKAETALIVTDTNELQSDDVPGLIAALNDLAASDVLTQVNAALDTAISELGVAAPAATPTLRTGLMLLYMALRDKTVTQTSGTDALEIYNDAGTKIAAKLITDDGSDYTEAKMA